MLKEKGRFKLMWIPIRSEIKGNKRAVKAAKNTLEEEFNDQELYPPLQDLINWLNKPDAKKRQERWAQGKIP
jgi:hypothetical protein